MKSLTKLHLAALSFAIAGGQPALAKDEYSTKEARELMHAYAKCVAKRQSKKASEALLANADNATIMRNYKMLIVDSCLTSQVKSSTEMRFSGDLYRYALADAMVNLELAARAAPDLSTVSRLAHREPEAEPQSVTAGGKKLSKRKYEAALKAHREASGFSSLSKYGECVVRLNSQGAKALLLTTPSSSEETTGFQALQPALQTCMPEGQTLRFGRVALRGSIAINYYRLAHAAHAAANQAAR